MIDSKDVWPQLGICYLHRQGRLMQGLTLVKIRFKELGSQNAMHKVKFFLVRCQRCHGLWFPEKGEIQPCGILFYFQCIKILWWNFWGYKVSVFQNSSGCVRSPIHTRMHMRIPTPSRRIDTAYHISLAGLHSSDVHFCSWSLPTPSPLIFIVKKQLY